MKIFIFFIVLINTVYAQTMDRQKEIEEFLKRRDEIMKGLLNDESFIEMEKRMLEMMKRFEEGAFDQGFDSSSFFKNSFSFGYDWKEDDNYKTLSLKVKQVKDRPLDIKIEKGMIKIKGSVEENSNGKKTMAHFERTFNIPSGVDEKNPEFENKEGELLIKFKKIGAAKKKMLDKNIDKKKENDGERIPVSPDDKNIQI